MNMPERLESILFFVFLFGLILLYPSFMSFQDNRWKKRWREIAEKHGWKYHDKGDDFQFKYHPFKMVKNVNGTSITIECVRVRKYLITTSVYASINTKESFSIGPKNLTYYIDKFFDPDSWEDIKIDHERYNNKFIIQASNPTWFKKVISSNFINHHLLFPDQIALDGGKISMCLSGYGAVTKESKLVQSVQLIEDWIKIINKKDV